MIEVLFTIGLTLAMSALIIQMRDLAQVLPIIIQLGLFVTPVIWEFSLIPSEVPRSCTASSIRLGPVIDDARRAMLLGLNPAWDPCWPPSPAPPSTWWWAIGSSSDSR